MLVSVILVVCFGSGGAPSSRPEKTFTTIGFKDWKHATGKHGILACHANCYSHKQAVVSWNQYQLNLKQGTLISEQLYIFNSNLNYIQRSKCGNFNDFPILAGRVDIWLLTLFVVGLIPSWQLWRLSKMAMMPKAVEAIGSSTQIRCFTFLLLLIIFW